MQRTSSRRRPGPRRPAGMSLDPGLRGCRFSLGQRPEGAVVAETVIPAKAGTQAAGTTGREYSEHVLENRHPPSPGRRGGSTASTYCKTYTLSMERGPGGEVCHDPTPNHRKPAPSSPSPPCAQDPNGPGRHGHLPQQPDPRDRPSPPTGAPGPGPSTTALPRSRAPHTSSPPLPRSPAHATAARPPPGTGSRAQRDRQPLASAWRARPRRPSRTWWPRAAPSGPGPPCGRL